MKTVLEGLDRWTDSILRGEDTLLSLEPFPDYYWEPHEMFFIKNYFAREDFYAELQRLTVDFVREHAGEKDLDLVREVCLYHKAVSPLNKAEKPFSITFQYSLYRYFAELLQNKNNIEIHKEPCVLEFETAYGKLYGNGKDIDYLLAVSRASSSGSMRYCQVREIENQSVEVVYA